MNLLPSLSGILQELVEEKGVPLPILSERTDTVYMLLDLAFDRDAEGGFIARIPGIAAYGGGETKEEAALALREALRRYVDAFGTEEPM